MLVSTFELLVKPIAPAGAGPAALARTIVQGYFLTISNTSAVNAPLRLTFTATTPNLDLGNTVTIRDVVGMDVFGALVPTADPKRLTYSLTVPANDTALVILQPDVRQSSVLTADNLEVRGYVEIAATGFGFNRFDLLLTPEHRGTFFSGNVAAPGEVDQLIVSLPTAQGQALYSVPQRPLSKDVLDLPPRVTPQPAIKDLIDNGTVPKVFDNPKSIAENLPVPEGNLQSVLLRMAQRIEDLESMQQGRAFIPPSERPAVGNAALNPVGNSN